mmetsp:Transcript_130265/g.225221  ORF Transcript_130265/g.225221 Transcript_130265/m.225221 type:complete len:317 (-) Transcript_130265:1379-2329(-)
MRLGGGHDLVHGLDVGAVDRAPGDGRGDLLEEGRPLLLHLAVLLHVSVVAPAVPLEQLLQEAVQLAALDLEGIAQVHMGLDVLLVLHPQGLEVVHNGLVLVGQGVACIDVELQHLDLAEHHLVNDLDPIRFVILHVGEQEVHLGRQLKGLEADQGHLLIALVTDPVVVTLDALVQVLGELLGVAEGRTRSGDDFHGVHQLRLVGLQVLEEVEGPRSPQLVHEAVLGLLPEGDIPVRLQVLDLTLEVPQLRGEPLLFGVDHPLQPGHVLSSSCRDMFPAVPVNPFPADLLPVQLPLGHNDRLLQEHHLLPHLPRCLI